MSREALKRAFDAGVDFACDVRAGRTSTRFDDWYTKHIEAVSAPDMGNPISQSHVDEFQATEHRFGLRDTIALEMLKVGLVVSSAYALADAMMQERAK